MAGKLVHSLTDDKLDLQKRIGCLTGIFQLFKRHQMGVSGRRLSDQNHTRTLQRHSQFTEGRLEEEFNVGHQRQPADMNSNRNAGDRQRLSTESSRASFSSSQSSSFSSVDRGTQPDPSYNDRITFSESAFGDSHCSVSPRIARQSAEFRDVVKDSMLKGARGLSIKTTSREENMNCGLKQRDNLRDLKLFKTADGVRTSGNQNVHGKLKQFVEVPAKLQRAEWADNECKEQRRMSDHGFRSKDVSRASYNGMETSRLSLDSREALSASKLRDLPRLSLDGRECMARQIGGNSLSNFQPDASLKRSCSMKEKGQNLLEVSVTQQQRSPSVIAKLMGLTSLPDSTAAIQNDRRLVKTRDAQNGLDAFNPGKLILDSKPPGSKKEPDSPRWITSEMKPISSSRIPVEQAPWKNQEKGATLLKQSSRRIRSPARQSNPVPSVYSEIEKRYKDIEFNQSGKDLRALKQILESIHAKGLLEGEKQEQASKFATCGKQESTLIKAAPQSAAMDQQNARREHFTEVTPRHTNSFRHSDSQTGIMKPVGRSPRSQTSKNMYQDHVVGSNEKCKSTQYSSRSQQQPKDNSASSPRNLGSTSPRIRLKKQEFEKQNQFPSHSSDASKHRLQVSKQPTESSSPGRKVQPRHTNKQQNTGQIPKILLEITKLKSQTNEVTLPEDKTVTLDSKRDKEATRTTQSSKVNGSHSASRKASKQVGLASNKSSQSSNHISLPVKHDETAPEHPSPVSVLNMSPYLDDSSTEEKQLATPPEDIAEGHDAFKSNLSGELGIASDISRNKLLSIDSLVEKLKRLNSTHDESRTDYIALLCDNTNPDHRYISEILLASGLLLREFSYHAKPLQLHPSGFLINPELFNVLEQTKFSAHVSIKANTDMSKCHRKLIFDAVNEILTKKLAASGNLPDYIAQHHYRLAKKAPNTQYLIKELCAEMEQLQPNKTKEHNLESEDESGAVKQLLSDDVMHMPSNRMYVLEGRMSEMVLDIERSLFKKLVNEIVISDDRLRPKSGSHRHNRSMK